MKKHCHISIFLAGALLACLGLLPFSSAAFGLSLMGPPRSILQEGENAVGFEFGYSEMDLEAFGEVTPEIVQPYQLREEFFTKYKIDKLQSTTFSARLDTNISKNWDAFVRLGATNASDDIKEVHADGSVRRDYGDFDGDYGFSVGVGTRTTFYKNNNVSWGGVFQVNWIHPGKSDVTDANDINFSGEAEIQYWEVQIAIGPTIEYDNVRVYGGPFLHFINGDVDIEGTTLTNDFIPLTLKESASDDLREKSQFGGFLGAQWKLGNNNTLITEGQLTEHSWSMGVSTSWKF